MEISKKQAKNTLSGKKKKTDVIKNVLAKPYENYWPFLSPKDSTQLKETLEKFLPRVQPEKIKIPYKIIKDVPRNERKKFREALNKQNVVNPDQDQQNLIFGINDVAKLIESREAGSVLIESTVQPRLLVQHILDEAVLYSVPVLVVPDLKVLFKKKCGLCGAVVALRKSVKPDSELGLIQQRIFNISENYPIPENHVHFHRRLDVTTITIPDSEDGRSVCVVSDSDDEESRSWHLRKDGKKRIFVPEKVEEQRICAFIDLDCSVSAESPAKKIKGKKFKAQYRPLMVKRVKGDKNRNKRKMDKFKKKKK